MQRLVTMHMAGSIDGRIVAKNWPRPARARFGEICEDIQRALQGDARIVGRITMAEFGVGEPWPVKVETTSPRITWKAPGAESGPYAISIDRSWRLHLNLTRANGDAIVVVLVETVSDDHVAELRRDGYADACM